MAVPWSVLVSFLSSAPFLLAAAGLAFLVLDFFAVYQLKKIYAPSVSAQPREDEAFPAVTPAQQACEEQRSDVPGSYEQGFDADEDAREGRDSDDEDEHDGDRRRGFRAALEQWAARSLPRTLFRLQGGDGASLRTLTVPPRLTGGQTRSAFMLLLSVAILARAVSLFLMAWIVSEASETPADAVTSSESPAAHAESPVFSCPPAADQPSPAESFQFSLDREWIVLFLDSAPSLIFFSALSLIVLFWAKIYYAAILIAYPHFEKGPWLCSGGLLAFFLLFFILAVLLQAKRSATRALQILAAVLFGLAAGAFFVYGTKVAKKLSERSKTPSRKNSIVRRVLVLALVCPVLFAVRSVVALRGQTPPSFPLCLSLPLTWHSQPLVEAAAVYVLTEWIPALLILVTFWRRRGVRNSVRSQQQRQLMQIQDGEERVHSMDSTVAAPLMHQNFCPLLAPPAYVQPPSLFDLSVRHNAAAGSHPGGPGPGESLSEAFYRHSSQEGLLFQPYAPTYPGRGNYPPGFGTSYNGAYYQQYYPPPAL
ncbi:hypothetical protein TGME49_222310 [Toxoplasma gondii ME49]|uniref:THH1/TOM1/TOM3 domain-containing protein n=2 Tax=Toxoplasma gondii TaxID=5811 RepID=S8F851_TOXGM|nr:hypothetical protein TGME49_222310 [Toxoplasma gondii ME49]EPT32071.1 hypothetical protein TGME49_222310 [Toxoplasma gondii ME49]|eukprot:XP_002370050.1 hypothetical protein TGME49_222310 [Toxoplasma gondii ME49]